MKVTLGLLGTVLALGLGQVSVAADFSYTGFDIGYQLSHISVLGEDVTFTGAAVNGQFVFAESTYLFVRGEQMTNADFNFEPSIESVAIGIGGFAPISYSADMFFDVGYGRYTIELGRLSNEELDGVSLAAGVRTQLISSIEVQGEVNNVHLEGDTNTMVSIAGLYRLTASLSPEVKVIKADESETVSIGVQIRF